MIPIAADGRVFELLLPRSNLDAELLLWNRVVDVLKGGDAPSGLLLYAASPLLLFIFETSEEKLLNSEQIFALVAPLLTEGQQLVVRPASEQRLSAYVSSEPVSSESDADGGRSFFYPLETEQRFIDYVMKGKDAAGQLIGQIIKKNIGMHISPREWEYLMSALMRSFKRLFLLLNAAESNFLGEHKRIEQYIHGTDRAGQRQRLISLASNLSTWVRRSWAEEDKPMAQRMAEYIHRHHCEATLSLNDVSAHFSRSPSYLSRLFKEHTGSNFKDLLSIERVKSCKHALSTEPNLTLTQLCLRTGFTNTSTLLRTFKKYTGITPGAYALQFRE